MTRDQLADYLDSYLACATISDYAPNGLQVEGREQIKRICSAVSITLEVIEKALECEADAILVHHGFFWRGESPTISGNRKQRLAALLRHDLNLFAYHLPLDVHLTLGNNACLAQKLPVKHIQQHDVNKIPKGLWTGELERPLLTSELNQLLKDIFQQTPIHIAAESKIQRIAWCTGAAQDFIEEAKKQGAQAYISGEISERTYDLAKELNIHYYACGHYATERYGIQALGQHLANKFQIKHQFIETHNPI